jgi:ribonuclease P protein component
MPALTVLTKRADFVLAAGSGFKCVKPSVIIQLRKRTGKDTAPATAIRVGYTATKTLGNAIIRNRTKRRMRAAAARLVPELGVAGCDYVFIGRASANKGTFEALLTDMRLCLKRLGSQISEHTPGQ